MVNFLVGIFTKQENNHPQFIKATLYKIKLKADFEEEFVETSVKDLKDEIKVAAQNGLIILTVIKLPGKRKMDVKSLLNGYDFKSDAIMR